MEQLLTEIDHVAIAVHDLDAAISWYERAFGATVEHRETVESDGVAEALLRVADSYIQLLMPTREDSPVAKYLERKGEGLHHVGYRVTTAPRRSNRSRRRAGASSTRLRGRALVARWSLSCTPNVLWNVDRARPGAGLSGRPALRASR